MIEIQLYDKTRLKIRYLKRHYPLIATKIEDIIDELCDIVLKNLELRRDLLRLNKKVYSLCDIEKAITSQVLCIFSKLYVKEGSQ
jgi:hypothetical protein